MKQLTDFHGEVSGPSHSRAGGAWTPHVGEVYRRLPRRVLCDAELLAQPRAALRLAKKPTCEKNIFARHTHLH